MSRLNHTGGPLSQGTSGVSGQQGAPSPSDSQRRPSKQAQHGSGGQSNYVYPQAQAGQYAQGGAYVNRPYPQQHSSRSTSKQQAPHAHHPQQVQHIYAIPPSHSVPPAIGASEPWLDPQSPASAGRTTASPEDPDPRQPFVTGAAPPYSMAAPYYYPGTSGLEAPPPPTSIAMQGYPPMQQYHVHPSHTQGIPSPYPYVYHALTWPLQAQSGPMWGVNAAQQHHPRQPHQQSQPPVAGWQGNVYGGVAYGGGGYGYDVGFGGYPRMSQPRPLPPSRAPSLPGSARAVLGSDTSDHLYTSAHSSGDDALAGYIGGMHISSTPASSTSYVGSRRATGSSLESSSHLSPPDGRLGNQRSDHVMWCGNVPANATVDELWDFFSKLPPADSPGQDSPNAIDGNAGAEASGEAESAVQGVAGDAQVAQHGVLSIFIISRSNCAFVNYISDSHLQRAVRYFSGLSLRPSDPLCPRLVSRVRKKIDEVNAGVGGQRGKGMHVAYAKEHDRRRKEEAIATAAAARVSTPVAPPSVSSEVDTTNDTSAHSPSAPASNSLRHSNDANSSRGSGTSNGLTPASAAKGGDSSSGSLGSSQSYSSTNSSLFRHPAFQQRFFILKGAQVQDIEASVHSGSWTTQIHNEQVLDQAYRNSETVILIFSANGSGSFFGYARMAGPIGSEKAVEPSTKMKRVSEDSEDDSSHPGKAVVSVNDDRPSSMDLTPLGNSFEPGNVVPGKKGTLLTPSDPHHGHLAASPKDMQLDSSESSSWPFLQAEATATTQTANTNQGRERGMMQSPSAPGALMRSGLDSLQASVALGSSDQIRYVQAAVMNAYSWPGSKNMPSNPVDSGSDAAQNSLLTRPGDALRGGAGDPSHDDATDPSISALTNLDPVATHDPSLWNERSLSELAIRAAIHNFRIDERESAQEAQGVSEGSGSGLVPESSFSEITARPATSEAPSSSVTNSDSLGRPFPIEWIKTSPLPFSETKNLRNPWRDNKQIKVSRDGTEVEPVVGNLLLQIWDAFDISDDNETETNIPEQDPRSGKTRSEFRSRSHPGENVSRTH